MSEVLPKNCDLWISFKPFSELVGTNVQEHQRIIFLEKDKDEGEYSYPSRILSIFLIIQSPV